MPDLALKVDTRSRALNVPTALAWKRNTSKFVDADSSGVDLQRVLC